MILYGDVIDATIRPKTINGCYEKPPHLVQGETPLVRRGMDDEVRPFQDLWPAFVRHLGAYNFRPEVLQED